MVDEVLEVLAPEVVVLYLASFDRNPCGDPPPASELLNTTFANRA